MITQEAVLDIAREAIYTTIITSAPLLLISLIVGLIVSIFQSVTSIPDKYFPDDYIDTGADTYICAKNNCNFSCDDALWLMDARHYVRIYD